jgi:hypothetical protein
MHKTLLATAAAASLVAATVSVPTQAKADCVGCWVAGGVAAGLVGGALLARPYGYSYGYYPYGSYTYGSGYGYPYAYAGYPYYGGGYGYYGGSRYVVRDRVVVRRNVRHHRRHH